MRWFEARALYIRGGGACVASPRCALFASHVMHLLSYNASVFNACASSSATWPRASAWGASSWICTTLRAPHISSFRERASANLCKQAISGYMWIADCLKIAVFQCYNLQSNTLKSISVCSTKVWNQDIAHVWKCAKCAYLQQQCTS